MVIMKGMVGEARGRGVRERERFIGCGDVVMILGACTEGGRGEFCVWRRGGIAEGH